MSKKNMRIISVVLLTCAAILVIVLFIYAKSSKKEHNTQDSESSANATESPTEIMEAYDIRPDTGENGIPTVINTESGISVNDVSTQNISIFLNSVIDDSYKTSSYACDIITQESMDKNIISIQIESSDFFEETACMEAAKSIIEQTMNSEYFSEIQAFDFSFMADSQVRYIMLVDDLQSISSSDKIEDHMKIQEF